MAAETTEVMHFVFNDAQCSDALCFFNNIERRSRYYKPLKPTYKVFMN